MGINNALKGILTNYYNYKYVKFTFYQESADGIGPSLLGIQVSQKPGFGTFSGVNHYTLNSEQ